MFKYFLSRYLSRILCTFFLLTSNLAFAELKSTDLRCDSRPAKRFFPVKNEKGAFQVGIGVVPLNITKFNLKESSAEVDFYLTIEYLVDAKLDDIKCVGDDAAGVWKIFYNPDIEFMSIPDPEYLQGWHWLVKDNRFIYMTRVKGTVFIEGNFRKFPFDSTKIAFSHSGEDNNEQLELHPSRWYHPDLDNISRQISGVKIPGWQLTEAKFYKKLDVAADGTGTWDVLTLELNLSRKSSTFVVRSGVPLILLFLVALCSLRIPGHFLDVRVATQAAVLLALFAYSIYFIESIPPTDYLTFGDFTWMSILVSLFLIIFSETLGHRADCSAFEKKLKKTSIALSIFIVLALCILGATLYFFESLTH